jgi:DNA-binding response OmpR family regulator
MKQEHKKVLVVEDEPKILEVIKSFLESKGYVVLAAENGSKALSFFEKENISLAILDLMLPDISGEELCVALRKKSRVPIIMVTAKVEEESMLRGLSLGADDYIKKPFSLKELAARIDAVMRRSSADLAPLYTKMIFREGDLEADFQNHIFKKRGREISLTPNEYRILATLIKFPNKVFTREELIMTALGDDFEGYDRVVDSHIKNIRQKIEDDSKTPDYVLTVRGIGYKFGGR